MTLAQLNTLLKLTGYPVAYSHFKEEVQAPYVVYLVDSSNTFFADNKIYAKYNVISIELYTDKKDLIAERTLEQILDENGLLYESYETWIDSEKLFQKTYEVRI